MNSTHVPQVKPSVPTYPAHRLEREPSPRIAPPTIVTRYVEKPPDWLDRINLRYLYHSDGRPLKLLCPAHQDGSEPNFAVFPRSAHCFACGFHETAIEHVRRVVGTSNFQQLVAVCVQLLEGEERPADSAPSARPIPSSLVSQYEDELEGFAEGRAHIWQRYGINVDIQRAAHIGYSSAARAYVIPVFDLDGVVQNIRYRAANPGAVKYWGTEGHNEVRWFYSPGILAVKVGTTILERLMVLAGSRTLIVTEGELDTLAVNQWGIPSISCTSGALALTSHTQSVSALFETLRGVDVLLAYDQDGPGIQAASEVQSNMRAAGLSCRTLTWDGKRGKDPSELLASGVTREMFRKMCKIAKT